MDWRFMADCPLPHLIAGGYITLYTGYDLWDLEGTIMKVWFIYLVLSGCQDGKIQFMFIRIYPLVNMYIAMENSYLKWENSL